MVRRDETERGAAEAATSAVSRCASPARGSLVPASVGAPGSRPQPSGGNPMPRRFGVLVVGVLGAWLVAAGCAASGSTNQVNGPAYDLDGGGTGPTNGDGAVSTDGAG